MASGKSAATVICLQWLTKRDCVRGGDDPPRFIMELIYLRIRSRARQIVFRFPPPKFYKDLSWAVELSRTHFDSAPIILRLRQFAEKQLENDFGHGFQHAVKVSLDAGALMLAECRRIGSSEAFAYRRLCLAQCAGLLHDIRRKEKDHAISGALAARRILKSYPLSADEIEDISQAIRDHEAFKDISAVNTPEGLLISDCLYDADKFRWGPDNFTDTIWDMVSFSKTPLPKFIEFYPKGMDMLEKAKTTFRSEIGKKYGPQFIDVGLDIGRELFSVIKAEFAT